ncbi:hypothetical protein [Morganella morganii]|uniref:phage tail fiber protein n=1 Tax=Morganella morganii TaxID=582 RepID=UPI003D6E124B
MIYTDGTIAIKAGSPVVTGTGTQWKKNIHGVAPGQMVSIENGVNPVNMMIRAVNSDTELVLSFNAPVTLSGAKYSIATTVPDTISDAARTMSANQGYIVYFLQAMQQWMTDTGRVEIELPNGQKVTLDSVKAMNEAIAKKADSSKLGTAAWKNVGTADGNVMEVGAFGLGGEAFASDGDMQDTTRPTNFFSQGGVVGQNYFGGYGSGVNFKYDDQIAMRLFVFGGTGHVSVVVRDSGAGRTLWVDLLDSTNTAVDASGYIKVASPIIQIHPAGNYETNDESEGAEVRRTGTGQYHITGILGYNFRWCLGSKRWHLSTERQ